MNDFVGHAKRNKDTSRVTWTLVLIRMLAVSHCLQVSGPVLTNSIKEL